MQINKLFSVPAAAIDHYGNLRDRFVALMSTSYFVKDGDTIDVVRDVGDFRVSIASLRIMGVDTPEVHTTVTLEKQAGLLVRDVVRGWIACTPLTDLSIIELPGGKYRGRFMGDVQFGSDPDDDLSTRLLFHKLCKPYEGGTKEVWSKAALRDVVDRATTLLEDMPSPIHDLKWAVPSISEYTAEHLTKEDTDWLITQLQLLRNRKWPIE